MCELSTETTMQLTSEGILVGGQVKAEHGEFILLIRTGLHSLPFVDCDRVFKSLQLQLRLSNANKGPINATQAHLASSCGEMCVKVNESCFLGDNRIENVSSGAMVRVDGGLMEGCNE